MDKFILRFLLLFFIIGYSSQARAQNSIANFFEKSKNGIRKNVVIEFSDDQGNTTHLPIVLIKGMEKGKTLTVLAGVNGYEYPPIMAVQQLIKEVEADNLKGNLIIIPISSSSAFYGRSIFKNPDDGVNLNNAFPGKEQGTVTEQIAYYITKNIIPQSDVFLDIHGGDASEDLMPFVCYYRHEGQPVATALAKELSETSGFTNVVSYPYTIKDTEPAKYAFKQAVQDGKVGLSFEAGKLGNVQEDAVALNKNGIYHLLAQLGMYNTNLPLPKSLNQYVNPVYIKSPAKGIFYANVKAGDTVYKGQEIGKITNEFGEILATVQASENGTILYMVGTPPVTKKDTLFCIALPKDTD
ncbi:succinylglutamate desuccinylase/aspartoacylase family protein [Croceivirga sp. JEA036]|uniref:succinylglutamate desuccinylase/aspartoacylase domain-containing protein n=1 Tax=Croceivirga sp. JEA036 TaxID=2721162 RepID=UPI00143B698E|nr:succinylglutamate desuccinylase/aspartoacylase family protein [Croceivirga sp. JEA036]NJB37420.1 succinylglutamate desuccinylase [Croceivirga sp. JEA036]